jgi:hypothetical protein
VPIAFEGVVWDPSAADRAAGFTGSWEFGDGQAGPGLAAAHVYAAPGQYKATARAADKDGGTSTHSLEVTVARRPSALAVTSPLAASYGFATIEARLSDAVDPVTGRAGGRPVGFVVGGQRVEAVTDETGLAVAALPTPLDPGLHHVAVDFPGDSLYAPSSAKASLRVVGSEGHVEAHVWTKEGGRAELAVRGGRRGPHGELRFASRGVHLRGARVTALGVAEDGRSAWVSGVARRGRTFLAYLEDNGRGGREDVFRLWIDGEPVAEGPIRRGDVHIRRR